MKKHTILVLENDTILLNVIDLVLKAGGYDTLTFKNPKEALMAVYHIMPIAMAIVDCYMGGLGFSSDIVSACRTLEIPVLMITGGDAGLIGRTFGVPVLRKPFTIEELMQTVQYIAPKANLI